MYNKPIRSDDVNALEKLTKKVEKLKENHEFMKAANKHFKENNTMKCFKDLPNEKVESLDKEIRDSYEKKPYPNWQLQNNLKNIRAAELRIRNLEREKNRQNKQDYDTSKFGFDVYENKDLNRLQLFFDSKPEERIRGELKRNGFLWSPSNTCWQRMLNSSARLSLNCFINFMNSQQHKSQMEM